MNKQPQVEPKNMILAVVLSMLIVFGWQYYFVAPQTKKAEEQSKIAEQQAKIQAQNPATTVGAVKSYAEAVASTKRVKIATDQFTGSINLIGAQLDDLKLNKYREQYE